MLGGDLTQLEADFRERVKPLIQDFGVSSHNIEDSIVNKADIAALSQDPVVTAWCRGQDQSRFQTPEQIAKVFNDATNFIQAVFAVFDNEIAHAMAVERKLLVAFNKLEGAKRKSLDWVLFKDVSDVLSGVADSCRDAISGDAAGVVPALNNSALADRELRCRLLRFVRSYSFCFLLMEASREFLAGSKQLSRQLSSGPARLIDRLATALTPISGLQGESIGLAGIGLKAVGLLFGVSLRLPQLRLPVAGTKESFEKGFLEHFSLAIKQCENNFDKSALERLAQFVVPCYLVQPWDRCPRPFRDAFYDQLGGGCVAAPAGTALLCDDEATFLSAGQSVGVVHNMCSFTVVMSEPKSGLSLVVNLGPRDDVSEVLEYHRKSLVDRVSKESQASAEEGCQERPVEVAVCGLPLLARGFLDGLSIKDLLSEIDRRKSEVNPQQLGSGPSGRTQSDLVEMLLGFKGDHYGRPSWDVESGKEFVAKCTTLNIADSTVAAAILFWVRQSVRLVGQLEQWLVEASASDHIHLHNVLLGKCSGLFDASLGRNFLAGAPPCNPTVVGPHKSSDQASPSSFAFSGAFLVRAGDQRGISALLVDQNVVPHSLKRVLCRLAISSLVEFNSPPDRVCLLELQDLQQGNTPVYLNHLAEGFLLHNAFGASAILLYFQKAATFISAPGLYSGGEGSCLAEGQEHFSPATSSRVTGAPQGMRRVISPAVLSQYFSSGFCLLSWALLMSEYLQVSKELLEDVSSRFGFLESVALGAMSHVKPVNGHPSATKSRGWMHMSAPHPAALATRETSGSHDEIHNLKLFRALRASRQLIHSLKETVITRGVYVGGRAARQHNAPLFEVLEDIANRCFAPIHILRLCNGYPADCMKPVLGALLSDSELSDARRIVAGAMRAFAEVNAEFAAEAARVKAEAARVKAEAARVKAEEGAGFKAEEAARVAAEEAARVAAEEAARVKAEEAARVAAEAAARVKAEEAALKACIAPFEKYCGVGGGEAVFFCLDRVGFAAITRKVFCMDLNPPGSAPALEASFEKSVNSDAAGSASAAVMPAQEIRLNQVLSCDPGSGAGACQRDTR